MKNVEFMKIVGMKDFNFYNFKKRYPKFAELAILGAMVEKLVKEDFKDKRVEK
jgi:hypothetical protein